MGILSSAPRRGERWAVCSTHCAAVSVRPVKISSAAFDHPISRGRNQVPPLSGTMPRLVKAAAILALSAMIRMSQPSAVSMP